MSRPTDAEMAVMIADPGMGACRRMREGCWELGAWLPFYRGYVCGACVEADQADVGNGVNPPGDGGIGHLFGRGDPSR